jgi:hypothetical protein
MPRFYFRIDNQTAGAVNALPNVIPPAWIIAMPSPIAVNTIATVILDVPQPHADAPPATGFFRYQPAAGGIYQINFAVPPVGGGAPNAAGKYVPPPAGGNVVMAPGPCPPGAPAGSTCYNVTFS